ncbi:MAG: urease accessory protein UreE [Gammaproteobacteria bacterium]|nr:urease accessory protein UreE [Gammaproteobacteria bacterium]
MLNFVQIVDGEKEAMGSVTLSFDQRVKSRLKVELDNGQAAGLFLPRGSILKQGDRIVAESGEVVAVRAADETVSTVYVTDPVLMARACYHLGNRHVALQIDAGFVRYQHDHVLDEMVAGLGLAVICEQAPFEPEAGAYDGGGHSHSHHESDHEH